MAVKGILFDLDGTLVDSAEDMYMALNLTLTEVAYPVVSHALVTTWVGNGIDMLVKRGLSGSMEVNPTLPTETVDYAISRFKLHYAEIVGQYAALYQNVLVGLSALAAFPKAIVTNKNRDFTETLLNKLGIASHFPVLVCGDDGQRKPSPEPLLNACKALGLKPEDVMMVGDSKSDLVAANAAGIPAIALTYGYHQGENLQEFNPQYLLDGFLDIIPVLMK
ncbi:phosphoglycolate phosphatase [Pseudoalteromonas xiamenensis]|uniref:phosphoglycolate phosphatase n=1 Tax=Pseudoalteromonas xiamenensis TaxID=882626 RepID=UPI0027E564EE|nr:phosphoglycolate phosphatase [Pseudoalteromonas xiamenensis]WMN58824.1 phosphoglycolate phosphatase [Pseudoalteromonas xiamenensis]